MRAARAKTVVPLVTAILALAALCMTDTSARAQDAPAACVTGNLKDNYLGQTCTLGNLTVRFDKDFPGASAVDPTRSLIRMVTVSTAPELISPSSAHPRTGTRISNATRRARERTRREGRQLEFYALQANLAGASPPCPSG